MGGECGLNATPFIPAEPNIDECLNGVLVAKSTELPEPEERIDTRPL
jgi:hypothetical protein